MSYKLNSNLENHIAGITNANSKLSDAYDILLDVKGMIDDGDWSGQSQKISKALCEICEKYHQKVLDNVKNEADTLKALSDDADSYMSSGHIPNEWR